MIKIGVIGMGFVGKAIYSAFHMDKSYDVKGYDVDPKRSVDSFEETVICDFVFLCLPTPANSDGSSDLSYINYFFDKHSEFLDSKKSQNNADKIFILKSTVPVDTTWNIHNQFGKNKFSVVHSPEFLSAKTALHDFLTATRHIVGDPLGSDGNYEAAEKVASLYRDRFPNSKIMVMTSEESEFVKYLCNCFYATKISFMNEMKAFADFHDLDWNKCLDGLLSSGWISPMHTQVPGTDGKLGYGGACFPKDMHSMLSQMKEKALVRNVLDGAIRTNEKVREYE